MSRGRGICPYGARSLYDDAAEDLRPIAQAQRATILARHETRLRPRRRFTDPASETATAQRNLARHFEGLVQTVTGYEHIIWDFNGTLLNDVHLCVDVINGMLRTRHMPEINAATYQDVFDFPVHTYYQRLGFDFSAEPFETLAAEYCAHYETRVRECELHADAVLVLDEMSKRGVIQSVLSNSEQQWLAGALKQFKIAGYFQQTVGLSNRYAAGKIEAGRALVERIGISPSRTLLVGDTAHDRDVAAELGVACVLISHGHHSKRRLDAVHHQVVDSLGRLVGLV